MVLDITPNTKFVYSLRHPFYGCLFVNNDSGEKCWEGAETL